MKDTIKIAAVQSHVYTEKRKNIEALSALLANGETGNADMVTLPEMFCCPYETDKFPLYAEPEGGETWQACSNLARHYGIYLSAGSMPELDEQGCVYNTAYVFDREGRQIAKHRKVHMFDITVTGGQHYRESDTLTPGNQITTFETEFGRMGICVCFDLRFPEMGRIMAAEGARLILCPAAFNMTTGPAHWEIMFRQRAVEDQAFVVGTAPERDLTGGYTSWGHTIMASPWGNILLQADEKYGIFIQEIDLAYADRVRQELPLLKAARTDLYYMERRIC